MKKFNIQRYWRLEMSGQSKYLVLLLLFFCFKVLASLSTYNLPTDPMKPSFLLTVLSKMEKGENIIFTKFGDGEYNCMVNEHGKIAMGILIIHG